MTTWEKVMSLSGDGRDVRLASGSKYWVTAPSNLAFLFTSSNKVWAYMKNKQLLLFYDSESGDIHIPRNYKPEEQSKIKGEFLYFISRDSHDEIFPEKKDTDYRVIKM